MQHVSLDAALVRAITGLAQVDPRALAGLPQMSADKVSRERRAAIMAEIETIIAERRFRVIGEGDDQAVWQKGWDEVAEAMRGAGRASLDALKPQYFHGGVELRLLGDYYLPDADYFEYWLGVAVRRQLMLSTFGVDPTRIVELGCGTGMNLVIAAELFPEAELVGSDWVQASVDILGQMAVAFDRSISGRIYNMLTGEGADTLPIDGDADVITVHALEQLGAAAPGVVAMLIARRPRTVLHIEPILEFYERADPYDDLAARYHQTRGYLEGLEPTLRERAAKGEIEILSEGRVTLGNLYHEAYSFISWRPV